jgi:hypothetical protein
MVLFAMVLMTTVYAFRLPAKGRTVETSQPA